MKKIFFTLSAMLAFGIAAAQTEPEVNEKPENPASTTPAVMEKAKENSKLKRDIVNRQTTEDAKVKPRKSQLRTRKHLKSTPDADRVGDTVKKRTVRKKTEKRN
ncbi:hypothetical protein [Flavobacterium sp. MK4S-17]|uniref:hypothetical protein n=1 Tax=Flavobacterium sp. MK4S-17 TaxID=2543737 RepID=UPI00135BDA1E|nr:hypothetical protein [Flavobacterium sp. MK4S-17]